MRMFLPCILSVAIVGPFAASSFGQTDAKQPSTKAIVDKAVDYL